jgi:hypothetical protein
MTQLGETVLPNISLERFQLHHQIPFTSTATTETVRATAVPNGPLLAAHLTDLHGISYFIFYLAASPLVLERVPVRL